MSEQSDIAAITKRLSKVALFPWHHLHQRLRGADTPIINEVQDARGKAVVAWGGFDALDRPAGERRDLARFIANAPEDINVLLEIVRFRDDDITALRAQAATDRAEIERLTRERDRQKLRADNHWETLRSIREIARGSGDLERIVQWVNDAGSGYLESAETTLAKEMDARRAAEAQRDALSAQVETARKIIPSITVDWSEGIATVANLDRLTAALSAESGTAEPQEPCRTCGGSEKVFEPIHMGHDAIGPVYRPGSRPCPDCQGGN